MRITKEPEERKQEILDTALRLFQEKGYEKTSISDIAKAIGVAQGLCYRYFPSKEALFDSVVDQYAGILVEALATPAKKKNMSLKQILEEMPVTVETEDNNYYQLFHGVENPKFHDQLSLKVCEKLVPIVTKLFEAAQANGEIHLDDIETAAYFCVYGQLGILLSPNTNSEEKEQAYSCISDLHIRTLKISPATYSGGNFSIKL